MASSWDGTRSRRSGRSSRSRPSVSSRGEVVSVSSAAAVTTVASRRVKRAADCSPSRVVCRSSQGTRHSGSPGVLKAWSRAVITSSHRKDRKLRASSAGGSRDIPAAKRTKRPKAQTGARPREPRATVIMTVTATSFVRGSRR